MPEVSVIIPVYNVEKYLCQCLDSVLGQTMSDLEVICVDDGSTDRSKEILEEYAAKDARVKVLYQANQYAGVARNNGLKVARGKYLLFLDSDDFIDKGLCDKTCRAAEACNADVVIFSADRFDEESQTFSEAGWYFNTSMLPEANPFSRSDMKGRLLNLTFLGPWNKLFRREFVEQQGLSFQPLHNSNDDYFVAMALSLADRITTVDKVLTHHRFGLKDNLQSRKHQHPLCFMEAYEAIYDQLQEKGIYEQVEKGFVSRVLADCVYHLKTMHGTDAKREICANIQAEHFARMNLLEYEGLKGAARKNQRILLAMMQAYAMEADAVLTEEDNGQFPDEYDYYAACFHMTDYYLRQEAEYTETEKLRQMKEDNDKLKKQAEELERISRHFLVRVDRKLRKIFGKHAG